MYVLLVGLSFLCSGCYILTDKGLREEYQQKEEGLIEYVYTLKEDFVEIRKENKKKLDLKSVQYAELLDKLRTSMKQEEVNVDMQDNRVSIEIVGHVLFASGSDRLLKSGRDTIEKICEVLKQGDVYIMVEGHTDSDQLKNTKHIYQNNWGLGAARAVSVLELLEELGIDSDRLLVSSQGEYTPIADNSTRGGRCKNRRVNIVLLKEDPYRIFGSSENENDVVKEEYIK